MTREEQIKAAALKECSSFDIPDKQVRFKGVNSAYGLGFCEGAMWADANPYIDWRQVEIQAAIAAMQAILGNDTRYKEAVDSWEEDHSFLEAVAKDARIYADNLVEELKLCKA